MLTDALIEEINRLEVELHDHAHRPIDWLFEVQGLDPKSLTTAIEGVAASTWAGYKRQGHPQKRSLPKIAALSWYAQIPIEAFFLGGKASEAWAGFDYDAALLTARLGKVPMKYFLNCLEQFCDIAGVSAGEIGLPLAELAAMGKDGYLMPAPLDYKAFEIAYSRALSFGLRNFRLQYDESIENVAKALAVSEETYRNMENPDKNSVIQMQLAFRLEKAFKITNTAMLLTDMGEFEGYRRSQGIRHAKATAIYRLHKHLSPENKKHFDAFTKTITILYR